MNLKLTTLIVFVAGCYILGCSSYEYVFPRFKNKYYYLYASVYSDWFGAWRYCSNKNMNALSIESRDENEFLNRTIREILPSYYYSDYSAVFWTSGIKFAPENWFYWTSIGKKFTYTNWNTSYPSRDSYQELVVVGISRFTDGLQWSTVNSNNTKGTMIFCEKTVDFP